MRIIHYCVHHTFYKLTTQAGYKPAAKKARLMLLHAILIEASFHELGVRWPMIIATIHDAHGSVFFQGADLQGQSPEHMLVHDAICGKTVLVHFVGTHVLATS